MTRLCSLPGCDDKHWCGGYCKLHYGRWYTTGSTDPPPRRPRVKLSADDEAEIIRLHALGCGHRELAARFDVSTGRISNLLRRHGVPTRPRGQPKGERHSMWKAQRYISHQVMHRYLRRERGPASNFPCIDCGEPAAEWSYNHSGISEVHDSTDTGYHGLRFSTDVMQYEPRCRICHLVFDGHNPLPLHEIVEIREQWGTGEWTLAQLARAFFVSRGVVQRIITGESWSMLTFPSPQVTHWRRNRPPVERLVS